LPLRLEALEDRTLLTTITWVNTQGGAWNVAGNWDLNRLPAAGDDVVIPALGSGVSVTHSTGIDTVQSVTSDANLILSGASTLQVTGNLQVSSGRALTFQGGTLAKATVTNGSPLVFTSGGGTLTNVVVNGDMDLSQQPNANVQINGGLVLNGTMSLGNATGSSYGRVNFAGSGMAAGSLTGNATVVFGGASQGGNFLVNYSNLTGGLGTLTIGAGVTLRGKNGWVCPYGNGSLVNQGTISADTAGGTINVGSSNRIDPFINQGTLNVSGGTLGLYGSLTPAGLGTINRSGGTVKLGGLLDLGGGTLVLNAATGSWNLDEGTIQNGTLSEADGAVLAFTSDGGGLTGMTVNGDLDFSQQLNAYTFVYGGLVLNGTMSLGKADGSTSGHVLFADSGTGVGSLTGNATVVFGGAALGINGNFLENYSSLSSTAGRLTIGAGVTLRGKNGSVFGNNSNGGLLNQGTISADTLGGTINIDIIDIGPGGGTFVNEGTLNVSAGTLRLYGSIPGTGLGTINVSGGTLGLYGYITLAGLGTVNHSGGAVNLAGTLDLGGGTLALNAATGSWNLLGGTLQNGTLSESDGALLVFTSSGGVLTNVTVNGDMDLNQQNAAVRVVGDLVLNGTMYLGNAAGTTYGRVLFDETSNLGCSLLGNATVVFGGAALGFSGNFLEKEPSGNGALGPLTLGPGVTIRGKNGEIFAYRGVVNQGTINADTPGGTIDVGGSITPPSPNFNYPFTNQGTLTVSGGTLGLYGNMTLASLGTVNYTSGSVNLGGTLDLGGGTLNLNAATGSWTLLAGAIKNGTINESEGSLLIFTSATLTGVGSSLTNVAINGDMDLSRENNANVRIYGGLVLNGTMSLGKADGSTSGRVYFADTYSAAGSLTGNATVVIGGAVLGANYLENDSGLAGAAGALTFGPGVTLHGKNAQIFSKYTSGSLINQGTISVDVAGGTFNIGGGGAGTLGSPNDGSAAFTNQGTLNVSSGATLGLYGSLTLAGQGTLNSSGGAVNLAGMLDLGGGTLTLNAASGSWTLLGGTLKNGTLNESGGALLSIARTSSGGVLTDMTVNGDLDLSQQPNVYIFVYGRLVLNGTMYLGNASGSTYGSVNFANNYSETASLTGNATVVFGGVGPGGSNDLANNSSLSGAAGALTIGPGVTIRGKNGAILIGAGNGDLVNQGTISADTAGGTILLGGNYTARFINQGTINASAGTLSFDLRLPVTLSGSAVLHESTTGTIQLDCSLLSTLTNAVQYNPQGTVTLSGTSTAAPQLLEAMSRDFGIDPTAYSQNYAYGTLALAYNSYVPTYVQLVDQARNSSGSGPEAVYTNFLIVPAGTTLDLNGLHLYTRAAQVNGTILHGTVTLIPDSGPLTLGVPTPGNISGVGEVDDWTFFGHAGDAVTVGVNPGYGGVPAPFSPPLGWAQVQLLDFTNRVLASASNTSGGTLLTLPPLVLQADGVYTIRINATPGAHASSTGNYVVLASIGRTATATTLSPSLTASSYGQAVTFTATVTSDGSPVGEGTVTFAEGSTVLAGPLAVDSTGHARFTTSALAVAGSPHSITATYNGSLSYEVSTGTTSFTVSKALLTVTASNPSRIYGDANPAFTASFAGFQNGETLATSGVTGAPSLTTTATAASPVGYYPVTAALGSLAAANYDFAFVNGTLAVYRAHLIVTADNASRVYGVANPTFTASYSGFKNGETLATSGVTGAPSLTTAATAASPVGTYVIRAALGSLAAGNYDFSFGNGTLTVTPAPLTATGVDVAATAGAPFSGVVATFANADPFGGPGAYTAAISWGDGSTAAGTITDNGDGTFSVRGSHTFADPASDTVQVLIQHTLGYTTAATTTATATVSSLGLGIEAGQSASIAFWQGANGQALIQSFNGDVTATALSAWLAATFPNLYGANAGANDLTGQSNADVAAFYQSLYSMPDPLDAEVLAAALNVYATTLALGGTAGQAYGFAVSDTGLGARSYNVGPSGAAFGVADDSTLNVYQLLLAANRQAVNGVLYDGDAGLRQMAFDVFDGINTAGGL
jgi:hypothetical protein